jgi:hypothetical protein
VRNPLAGAGENCPTCGASLAPDQRYCLNCGQRRGDPRLPFMDAVTFMDASRRPQPQAATAENPPPAPADRRPLLSANASLVAGVATLVLAIGVGVLIGRTGDSGSSNVAAQPQIIKVGGSGGSEVEGGGTQAQKGKSSAKGSGSGGGGKKQTAIQKKAKEKTEITQSGTSKATEEAYPVAPGVKMAPPKQELGGECEPGVAGCSKNGKFEGTFFE